MVSRGGEDFARQQQWCNRFEEARFSPGVASFPENVLLRCWRPGRFALVSSRSQNLPIHGKYLVVRVLLLLLSSKRSILLWHKINKYVWTQLHFWVCPQYCTSTASFLVQREYSGQFRLVALHWNCKLGLTDSIRHVLSRPDVITARHPTIKESYRQKCPCAAKRLSSIRTSKWVCAGEYF